LFLNPNGFCSSIIITLLPADANELECRFDSLHTEVESVLCRKLARWTQDHFAILQACNPPMPPSAYNRLADNWRPLFAIAQAAGGDWPRRAFEAFNHLTSQRSNAPTRPRSNDFAVELLSDIRQIFAQSGASRLSCKQLASEIQALARSGFEPKALQPQLTPRSLGHRLHGLGICARSLRIGSQCAKGYELADFDQAFARFLKEM